MYSLISDLHQGGEELYPLACSTAAETELELGERSSRKLRLQDKCYAAILQSMGLNDNDIDILPLPNTMKHDLKKDRHNASYNAAGCYWNWNYVCTTSEIYLETKTYIFKSKNIIFLYYNRIYVEM